MVAFTLRLPPVVAGLLIAWLTTWIMTRHSPLTHRGLGASGGAYPTVAQQHADAIEALVTAGGGAADTEVVVHIRGDGCSFDDGTPLSGSVVEQIAPSAFLRVLIHDANNHPINASGRQRPPARGSDASSRNATRSAATADAPNSSNTTTSPPLSRAVTRWSTSSN